MSSAKFCKTFILILLAAILFSACGFWQTSESDSNTSSSSDAGKLKSEIPFATKEPEIFQADFVITNYANGEKSERKIAVARNGEKHRYDYPSKTSFLQLSENERVLIDNERKVYEKSRTASTEAIKADETLKDFLTTKWLNEKHDAKFENLGGENGLTKYRVVMNRAGNKKSETIIYFDEKQKIPVKQEFLLTNGEEKTKIYTMEIRDLKLAADKNLFKVPADYRPVSVEEFQGREKALEIVEEAIELYRQTFSTK